jgi:CHAD domain-containing protein
VANLAWMPDDRIAEWALGLVKHDVRAFKRARARFLRQPSAKRLHDLRTTARRLRCIHEDLEGALAPFSLGRLRHVIELTGDARDAAVLRETLRDALDVR